MWGGNQEEEDADSVAWAPLGLGATLLRVCKLLYFGVV